MYYTNDGINLYAGDMVQGDREATTEEVAQYKADQLAKETAREANDLRDQAMLTGVDYQGSMISLTKEDGDGMLQVEASFNRIQDAITKGLLPINTEVKTKIHFKNGTELPMTAADFPSFALWFVLERGKFFV